MKSRTFRSIILSVGLKCIAKRRTENIIRQLDGTLRKNGTRKSLRFYALDLKSNIYIFSRKINT